MIQSKSIDLEILKYVLKPSEMQEVANVLSNKLYDYFEEVKVSIVDCPDLSKEPFNLASKGLCGKTAIADIGGVPFLVPSPNLTKPSYDLIKIAKNVGQSLFFF